MKGPELTGQFRLSRPIPLALWPGEVGLSANRLARLKPVRTQRALKSTHIPGTLQRFRV